MTRRIIFLGALLFSCFLCSPASATEKLLDNNLDLKTERLNKKQEQNNNSQSFIAEDQLFQPEMTEKMAHAKKVEETQQATENAQLFLTNVPKTKETDPSQLFTATESKQTTPKSEETATAVSSPIALYPLLIGALLVTVVTLVLYYSRKRGQQNGR